MEAHRGNYRHSRRIIPGLRSFHTPSFKLTRNAIDHRLMVAPATIIITVVHHSTWKTIVVRRVWKVIRRPSTLSLQSALSESRHSRQERTRSAWLIFYVSTILLLCVQSGKWSLPDGYHRRTLQNVCKIDFGLEFQRCQNFRVFPFLHFVFYS